VTAQTILLESERTGTALVGQQLGASIDLIRALGGTWSSGAEKAPAQASVDSARKSP